MSLLYNCSNIHTVPVQSKKIVSAVVKKTERGSIVRARVPGEADHIFAIFRIDH